MKIKFKRQPFQTNAVEAVADCFAGQPLSTGIQFRIDPGRAAAGPQRTFEEFDELAGFKNASLAILASARLENIHVVQRRQNLPTSSALVSTKVCPVNLDIEMETGTGKTYCYIKTMFELHQRYGWSKFIVVVPSIAIREGVRKSFEITAEHFLEEYGKRARVFIYNFKELHNLESFSSDAGINVMIINVQAFNATGKDARLIYEELDAYNQKLVKKIAVRGVSVKGLSGTNAYLYVGGIQIATTKPPMAKVELEIKQAGGIKRVHRNLGRNDNLYDLSGGLDQYKGFVISDIDAVRRRVRPILEGHSHREDTQRLFFDRQENEAPRRPDHEEDGGDKRRNRRCGCVRPDSERQGTTAVVRGASSLYLLALRPPRRLGQSEPLRDLHAEAQRQHGFATTGSRTRNAAVSQPAWRSNGRSRHGPSGQCADGCRQRELQGFRQCVATRHQRISFGPPATCRRRILHRQSSQDPDRRRASDAAVGQADLPVSR